jgi:hypothetical protein
VVGKVQEFLELTPLAASFIVDAVPKDLPWRGIRISVRRGAGDKSRLTVNVFPSEMSGDSSKWPGEKDPAATLAKLWGWNLPEVVH